MHPRELFEANLDTIERVIAIVCRRGGLFGADAEDFASEARVALIEDDYAILAKYEGRSSLDTFLTVVIRRLLADSRTRAKGRWHASSEAQRLGPAAVLIETLIRRDGRTLDEAMPHIHAAHPGMTRDEVNAILERLPERLGRPRRVDLDAIGHALAGGEAADARAIAGDLGRMSDVVSNALTEQFQTFSAEDRLLIRLRFASDMSIADISRMMRLPQRPLYRRLESLLGRLRGTLANAGIDRATAVSLVDHHGETMNFGLRNGKIDPSSQSIDRVADHVEEES
jgi:RNA polymerase sigma factor for flagellar operon FliA